MADVAKRARVSRTAAAKVLFNSGGSNTRVGAKTAERIRRIAHEMRYQPHIAAQQLAGKPARLIGVILDAKAPIQFTRMLETIEGVAAERNFRLLVGYVNESYEQIAGYVKEFRGRGVEGVICLAHTYPDLGHRIPPLFHDISNTVFIHKPLGVESVPYITPDYEKVGYLGTCHLLEQGCRRIVLLRSQSRYQGMLDWRAGYQRAIEESGQIYQPEMVWHGPTLRLNRPRLVNRCLGETLRLKPDAIFASNDESALWVIRGLRDRGIRVPEDIAVLSGCRQTFGRGAIPAITAIDQRGRAVAKQAARLVCQMAEGDTQAGGRACEGITVPPRLIVAESCGAAIRKRGDRRYSNESPDTTARSVSI